MPFGSAYNPKEEKKDASKYTTGGFGGAYISEPEAPKKNGGFIHNVWHTATSNYNPVALNARIGVNLLRDIKSQTIPTVVGLGHLGEAIVHDSTYSALHGGKRPKYQTAEIAKGMAQGYKQYYTGQEIDPKTGKVKGGGVGGLFHNLYTHPLQPLIDALTVVTAGGGAAAKLGEAGFLGERGAQIGKAGTRGFKVPDAESETGFREVTKPTSANPATRAMENLRHTLLKRSVARVEDHLMGGRQSYLNETRRGIRIEDRVRSRTDQTALHRELHPFEVAFRGLNATKQVAISLRAQGLHPTEFIDYLKGQRDAARTAMQQATDPKVKRYYRQEVKNHGRMMGYVEKVTPEMYDAVLTDPKMSAAHQAASDLMGEAARVGVDFGLLHPEDIANRPYLAVRVMRGAQYTPYESAAQQALEASPTRAVIHKTIDSVAPSPEVAQELKNVMDSIARSKAARDAGSDQEAAQLATSMYDELSVKAVQEKFVPRGEWEGKPQALAQAAKSADVSREGIIDNIWAEVQQTIAQIKREGPEHTTPIPSDMLTREGVAAKVDELTSMALEGEFAKAWYTHSGQDILEATGGDLPAARKIARLVAVTSPQQAVFANTRSAIQLWNRYKELGDKGYENALNALKADKELSAADSPIGVKGLISRDQYSAALDILRGKTPKEGTYLGPKTHSFYRNFLQEFDPKGFAKEYPDETAARGPVTFDTWMRRALGYPRKLDSVVTKTARQARQHKIWQSLTDEQKAAVERGEDIQFNKYVTGDGGITTKQYAFGEHVISAIGDSLGWKPHEAQAAIWTAIKNAWEGDPGKGGGTGGAFHIGDAIRRLKDEEGTSVLFQKADEGLDPNAAVAAKAIEENSGATLNRDLTPDTTDTGYMASYGAYEHVAEGIDPADLTAYRNAHDDVLRSDEESRVGAWNEDGKTYLDVSRRFDTEEEALAFGREQGQLAIWDAAKGESIPTGLSEAEANAIKDKLKASPQRVGIEGGEARGIYIPKGGRQPKAKIVFGQSAAEDTVAHEFGHHIAELLKGTPEEKIFATRMGAKLNKDTGEYEWPREAEEMFANTYLTYLRDQKGALGDSLRKLDNRIDFPELHPNVRSLFDRLHKPKRLSSGELKGGPAVEDLKTLEGLIAHPHLGKQLNEGVTQTQRMAGASPPLKPGLSRLNKGFRLQTSQWLPGPAAFKTSFIQTLSYAAAVTRGKYAWSVGRPLEDIAERNPGWYLVREGAGKPLRSELEAPALDEAYHSFLERDGSDLEKHIDKSIATKDEATAKEWIDSGDTVRQISPGEYRDIFGEFKQASKFVQRYIDSPTNFWRTLTLTYRPAWVVNNVVGQSLLFAVNHAGKGSLKAYYQAAKEEASGKSTIPDELRYGFVQAEAPRMSSQALTSLSRTEHNMRDKIQRFNASLSDNIPRNATYKAIINKMAKTNDDAGKLRDLIKERKGDTRDLGELKGLHDQIVQEVLDELIDFGNLTDFERRYIRRAVPFYSWIKGITKATAHLGFHHPARALILLLLARDGQRVIAKDFGVGASVVPGFLPIGRAVNGVYGGLGTTGLNPWATPGQTAGAALGLGTESLDPADNPILQAAPWAQAAITALARRDLYSGKAKPGSIGSIFLRELIGSPPQTSLVQDLIHPKAGARKLTPQHRSDLILRYLGIPYTHKRVSTAKSLASKPPGR